jgi:type I restriction enzyme R subunit
VSRAVSSDEVIDIFAAAGLKKPDISVLSDEFLAEVRDLPHRNLAVEMLRKLLDGEIKQRSRKNVVQARSFLEMLENSIKRYQNRTIETAAVIEELIGLAKEMREAQQRGEQLGLTEGETAFYDALEVNDSAVKVLGDTILKQIAQNLVKAVRSNLTIDWTVRENVRANLRVIIKRIFRKHGYPPDKEEKATATVLEQAEALSQAWTAGGEWPPGARRFTAMSKKRQTFGQVLREARLAKGITLRKFAEMVGISPTYLSQVEQDHVDRPTAERVRTMASLLGGSAEEWTALAGRVPEDLPGIIQKEPTADTFTQTHLSQRIFLEDTDRLVFSKHLLQHQQIDFRFAMRPAPAFGLLRVCTVNVPVMTFGSLGELQELPRRALQRYGSRCATGRW